MTQTLPASLVATHRPSLTLGYAVLDLAGASYSALTSTSLVESPAASGNYRINGGVVAPLAGGFLQWWRVSGGVGQELLATVAIPPSPKLTATEIQQAVGLASANLDSQLTGISSKTTVLPASFPTNFASLAITAGGAVTAGTVSDKTGYSLTQAFPANFPNLAITASTGHVTVGTNNDKAGYSLSGTQTFNLTGNITGNLTGSVGSVTNPVTVGTNNDKTGYGLADGAITAVKIATDAITADKIAANAVTAAKLATDAIGADQIAASAVTELQSGLASQTSVNTLQTAVNAIPTTAAPTAAQNASQVRTELTIELARIDATISSRLASSGYTTPPTTGQIRTELATELARIDVATSTRLAAANYTAPPTAATIADAVWDETLSQHLSAGSTGAKLNLASTLTVGNIPAGLSAQQVWEYATRTLSVASGLTTAQESKLNELYRQSGLDPSSPVTRTLNSATGTVAETFTGAVINHVEAGTTVTTTRQAP
jgi:hypothetical protein